MGKVLDAMKAAAKPPGDCAPETNGKAEPPATPVVAYRCGHTEPIKAFLAEDCPACRNKSRAARAKKVTEKLAAKQAAKVAGSALGRLPNGASFSATYDAAKQEWTGALSIGDEVFTDTASGLQKGLLSKLDSLYRASLNDRGA